MNKERGEPDIKTPLYWVEKELVLVKDELKSIKFKSSTSKVKKWLS